MRPLLKGTPVKSTITKKFVKGAFGLAASALIGYLVKLEMQVEDRIDEYYDAKDEQDN
jgi:hypothetical protein